ncbi:MAG: HTH domain-containing protein, partial [Synergistaceae bacterium]|nr:HTH domain-containing protein [Synergistaceae bacterium]
MKTKTIFRTTTVTKWDFSQEDNRNTKDEILDLLEASRGEFISGESIAERFNVTRAAIWKVIASLRNDGHKIKAVPNRG